MTKAWRLAGRWISILMVVCFFLPFFGISCAGQEIVTISGTDMVWGGKPGGMLADAGDMGGGDAKMKVEKIDPEPLAIAAFACALIVASLAWVRKRGAIMGAAAAAIVGFGLMIGMYVKIGGDLKDKSKAGLMAQQPKQYNDDSLESGMEDMARDVGSKIQDELPEIESGPRMGFWLVSLLFLLSGTFAGFGLKDPGPSAAPPAAGGPPVAYQMVYVPPGQAPPPGSMPPPGGMPPGGMPPGGMPPR